MRRRAQRRHRARGRVAVAVPALLAAALLAGCGGHAHPTTVVLPGQVLAGPGTGSAPAGTLPSATEPDTRPTGRAPSPARSVTSPGAAHSGPAGADPPAATGRSRAVDADTAAIRATYARFLYAMSGLDANLNASWLPALAEVTTARLAEAITRQASVLARAHEHAVGTLVGHNMTVRMTGPDSAALADCEDYKSFYLVDNRTGKADKGIERGYFVGTAQLVRSQGRWLVDVFATTHVHCTF